DFDRDGDLDLLITTNNGPAYLYRNDQTDGNRSIRFRLIGTKSNRDAIGAAVRIFQNGRDGRLEQTQSRLVRGGSSYLSQSELPVTFGVGKNETIDRVTIVWPGGAHEEYKDLPTGKAYEIIEHKGITK
ncbi:MAG: ASPIC/UnbV domain-containing protein, partial [Candidatus Acidiferrum sp.]